jgi:hypothetical protein
MSFIEFVNANSISAEEIISQSKKVEEKKKAWRYIFVGLYVSGAILLTYSHKFEKE